MCYKTAALIIHIHLQVEYKKDLENTKGHSINFCETPQFQNAAKVAKFTSDVSMAFFIIMQQENNITTNVIYFPLFFFFTNFILHIPMIILNIIHLHFSFSYLDNANTVGILESDLSLSIYFLKEQIQTEVQQGYEGSLWRNG